MPTYHEVMTIDLGLLTTAAGKWDEMAAELHKVETRYGDTVQKITTEQTWIGVSSQAAHSGFAATRYEYGAAQTQAKAIASLLRQSHEKFAELRKKLESARADAIAAGMTVSEGGRVAFDYGKLTPAERSAYHHDPDGQASISNAVSQWQAHIDDWVRAFAVLDEGVRTALASAVVDSNRDLLGKGDETLNGFNAHPETDLAKAGAPRPDKDVGTKTDGWTSEGEATFTGPDVGASASGTKYGKEASAKAYADLFHTTAKGSLTNGDLKLSGIADGYAGARASANWGFTDKGVNAKAEASVGARALAEGRVDYGHVGAYGRAEGFAGAEGQLGARAGKDGVTFNAKGFAGAKGSVAGGAEVGGIGVGSTAEGWYGPGAEAKLTFGKEDDGKFHIGGKVGLSPGVGGAVGLEFTVDPDKVVDAAGDAADAVGDFAGSVTDTVGGWFD